MSLLDYLIGRTVGKAVEASIERHVDAAIDRAVANSPVVQFIKAMQMQMLACDPSMDVREAWNIAGNTLRSFLDEEGVKFGDPAYDWTRSGAVDLIYELEMCHWEKRDVGA